MTCKVLSSQYSFWPLKNWATLLGFQESAVHPVVRQFFFILKCLCTQELNLVKGMFANYGFHMYLTPLLSGPVAIGQATGERAPRA